MEMLAKDDFQLIRSWVYRIARPIETALWNYHFENGDKEAVLTALSAYQNADGGFGHALEADNWNPNSSPATTGFAIGILEEIHFDDKQHPILQGILKYITSTAGLYEKGWPWSVPSNNDYAHASWYTYDAGNKDAYLELTSIELAFFAVRHADEKSEIYKKAAMLMESSILKSTNDMEDDFFTISAYCKVIKKIEQSELVSRFEITTMKENLTKLVNTHMERDPAKWSGWCGRPSSFIESPDSKYYKGNEDIMSEELDWQLEKIIGRLSEYNVWNVNANGWYWFDNNQGGEYPMESFVSANCWEIIDMIKYIKLFKNFGRMDFN
ncbi:MAG: hypothetical protein QM683_22855 [Lacrimispora sp.]